jgi:hypothetical protein
LASAEQQQEHQEHKTFAFLEDAFYTAPQQETRKGNSRNNHAPSPGVVKVKVS